MPWLLIALLFRIIVEVVRGNNRARRTAKTEVDLCGVFLCARAVGCEGSACDLLHLRKALFAP